MITIQKSPNILFLHSLDIIYGLTAAPATPPGADYIFLPNRIASPADKGKYAKHGYTNLDEILPPPNWRYRYPEGKYSVAFPPPDISTDEHFQVWMRTAGWSNFLKTYGRGTEVLPAGNYQLRIDMSKRLGFIELRGGCMVFSWQSSLLLTWLCFCVLLLLSRFPH